MKALPSGWIISSIEALLSAQDGGRLLTQGWSPRCHSEPARNEHEWAVLKTTAIQDGYFIPGENKRLLSHMNPRPNLEVHPGDLLITCAGPRRRCGVACLVRTTRPRLMISGKMYRFRVPEGHISSAYIEYFLRQRDTQKLIDDLKTGISDSGLNLTHQRFFELPVSVPPFPEQRRIVAKINSLSAKSRRARDQLDHIPRLVEKYKQAILAAAFTGELTRGWRKQQGKQLPSWISQAWENAGETLNGRAFPSADYSTTGVKLLRPGNLHASGRVEWTAQNTRFLPVKYSNDFPRYLFKGSELVINLTAQSLEDAFLGRACLSSKDDEFLLNQRIALFRPFEMDKKYCLYVLKSPLFREFVDNGLNAGSLIQHVHTKQLMKFVFPIAPPQEQKEIVSRIEIAFAWIDRLVAEATSARKLIDHLDQAILATAFLGELVRQDPNDEPAGVLLERIRAERQAASTPRSRGKKQKADA